MSIDKFLDRCIAQMSINNYLLVLFETILKQRYQCVEAYGTIKIEDSDVESMTVSMIT